MWHSSLCRCVDHIIRICPQKEMRGIDTDAIITSVQDHKSNRNRTTRQLIGKSVSVPRSPWTCLSEIAISTAFCTFPRPAFIRISPIHKSPESDLITCWLWSPLAQDQVHILICFFGSHQFSLLHFGHRFGRSVYCNGGHQWPHLAHKYPQIKTMLGSGACLSGKIKMSLFIGTHRADLLQLVLGPTAARRPSSEPEYHRGV